MTRSDATEDALAEVRRSYAEAFNAGDAGAVADLHTEGSISMPAGSPSIVGREAIEEHIGASLAAVPPGMELDFGFEPVDVRVAQSWAIERGITRGSEEFPSGKYVLLYEREDDGRWTIAWTMTNSDAPRPD